MALDDLLNIPENMSNINKYFNDLAYQRNNINGDAYKTEMTGFLKDLLNALTLMYKDHNYTNKSLNKVLEEMANSHIINSAGFATLEKFLKDFNKFTEDILNSNREKTTSKSDEETTTALVKSLTENEKTQEIFRTLLEHSMSKSASYQEKTSKYNEQLVDGFAYLKERFHLADSKDAVKALEDRQNKKHLAFLEDSAFKFCDFIKKSFESLLKFFEPKLYDLLYIGLALFGQYIPKVYEFGKNILTGISDFLKLTWLTTLLSKIPFVKPLIEGAKTGLKEGLLSLRENVIGKVLDLPGMKNIKLFIKQVDEFSELFIKGSQGSHASIYKFNKGLDKLVGTISGKLGFLGNFERALQPGFKAIQNFLEPFKSIKIGGIGKIVSFIQRLIGRSGMIFSGNVINIFEDIVKFAGRAKGALKLLGKLAAPIGIALSIFDFIVGALKTETSEKGFIGVLQRIGGGLANVEKSFIELGLMITNAGGWLINKLMDFQHWVIKSLGGAVIGLIGKIPVIGETLATAAQNLLDTALSFQEGIRIPTIKNTEEVAGQIAARTFGAQYKNGQYSYIKDTEEAISENGAADNLSGAEFGKALAKSAHSGKNGIGFGKSLGRCGLYVGNAVEKVLGKKEAAALRGNGKDWAINLKNNVGRKYWDFAGTMSGSQLTKLPAGSILSWPASTSTNGTKHPWGHVEIADGKGNLVSDFSRPGNSTLYKAQDPNLKANVFTPKGTVAVSTSVGEPATVNESDQTNITANISDEDIGVSQDEGMSFDQLISHLTNLTNFSDTGTINAVNSTANSMASQTNFTDTGAITNVSSNTGGVTNITVQTDAGNTVSEISDVQLIQQMCAMPIS